MSQKKTIKFIALDVHQHSITLAIADGCHAGDGEIYIYLTLSDISVEIQVPVVA